MNAVVINTCHVLFAPKHKVVIGNSFEIAKATCTICRTNNQCDCYCKSNTRKYLRLKATFCLVSLVSVDKCRRDKLNCQFHSVSQGNSFHTSGWSPWCGSITMEWRRSKAIFATMFVALDWKNKERSLSICLSVVIMEVTLSASLEYQRGIFFLFALCKAR